MIKASVIIPTYKRPDETAKCLELLSQSSFLGQKFELEVVVIDSSPDIFTERQIRKYARFFKLNYIHLKKQTLPGEARNLGIKKAKNELIICLDSDIEVKPETVFAMIDFLQKHPSVARMTGKSIFSSGTKKGQVDRPTDWDRKLEKNGTLFIEGIYGRYEAFYKSAFSIVGGYDQIFEFCGEGTDISVKFWRAGYPLAIDENIIAYHNSDAPGSLRRIIPDRMTHMYRSLFLVVYKYGVNDVDKAINFVKSQAERQDAYGETIELHSIISAAESIEWFAKNYRNIIKSKQNIPTKFDFKPYDVFTDQKLLDVCLDQAHDRIAPFYAKAFKD